MFIRLILAGALALGLSSPALAQTTTFGVTDCIGYAAQPGPGNSLLADQSGKLCVAGGGGSVGSAGTNGAQAQSVQGINGGVPQNVNLLPTTTAGIAPVTSSTSSLSAKTSAGNLYGFGFTLGGTAGYVVLLNAATPPTSGAAISPVECLSAAANGGDRRRQDIPDRYSVGIQIVVSTSCTTYTPVTPVVVHAVVQ